MAKYNYIESAFVHGGLSDSDDDNRTGAVCTPVYLTSTYKQDGLGKLHGGYEYSRSANPTRTALERQIAGLEGGTRGFALASGMAAIDTTLRLLKSGDKVLINTNFYGGTYRILSKVYQQFGLNFDIVDMSDPDKLDRAVTPDVRALFVETPANPLLTVTDIKAVAAVAHAKDALLIVDNTFMTPYLQRPLELGADIVLHSATKYLGGHSDLIAGLIAVRDSGLAEKIGFIQNSIGNILQPFDSFLLARSIMTLGVRMDRHVKNAEHIVKFLRSSEAAGRVYYPDNELNRRQASGSGAIVSFELNDGYDLNGFFERLSLITLAESLGGAESLVCHPASMTHASIPEAIRAEIGITDRLIRLSVGIENVLDIEADLQNALRR